MMIRRRMANLFVRAFTSICLFPHWGLPAKPPALREQGQSSSERKSTKDLVFEIFVRGWVAYDKGDYVAAISNFRTAADLGFAPAQYRLGIMYTEGKGLRNDLVEAAKWYRRAAEQGLDDAQHMLGLAYQTGKGVPQSYQESVNWFRLAAMQDHSSAQLLLAMCYDNGTGVRKDANDAVKWYRLSADQGNPGAQMALGFKYALGQGVPQSYVHAHMWMNLATAAGYPDGDKARDQVVQKMTPHQLEEAQRLAAEWRPRPKTAR